jgi:hypothetical protein
MAVDNDVLLKAACYGLALRIWSMHTGPGVLGAARFVLADAVAHSTRVHDKAATSAALAEFFAQAQVLEPTPAELNATADLERLAQQAGVELDTGESQLAVMVVSRGIPFLDTGDKRAVRGFEVLIGTSGTCQLLGAHVRCLEQLLLRVLHEAASEFAAIAAAVCAEPDIDKATSICFSCYSAAETTYSAATGALASYVDTLRAAAPTVLAD